MDDSLIHGLGGGMLIGLAAVILFWFNGRIMGVSGIISRLLAKPNQDSLWRLMFVSGLVLGGFLYSRIFPVTISIDVSFSILIIAGLLVGFGSVLGNGCTSGHGICGMARLSKRSIVATIVFMTVAIMTVWIMNS